MRFLGASLIACFATLALADEPNTTNEPASRSPHVIDLDAFNGGARPGQMGVPEAGEPLSAIDWLSQSVEQPQIIGRQPEPVLGSRPNRAPVPGEAPVAGSATTPDVTVQPLDGPAPRAIGVLPQGLTGLPRTLWQASSGDVLADLLTAQNVNTLPAIHHLLNRLILAEALPPIQGREPDLFLRARIDMLLNIGALEPALALAENAGPTTPDLFRRYFDISLLNGTASTACRRLRSMPDIAPTPATRVFCLARAGDWQAAALTLNTATALGDIDPATAALMSRFLDPDLFEDVAVPAPPATVTPLIFRLFEAIGAPLSTSNLPRAFAFADLRESVGWKAQLEAAERLSRFGAIEDNRLIGLYLARHPAASGAVWDRAGAVQALDRALDQTDPDGITRALARLEETTGPQEILPAIARGFSNRLITSEPGPEGRADLFRLLLMTDQYEAAALREELAETAPFLAKLAQGAPQTEPAEDTPAHRLIVAAFSAPPDTRLIDLAEGGQTGEAILRTLAITQQGLEGSDADFVDGIATLRALGLEDTARQTALQYLLLER